MLKTQPDRYEMLLKASENLITKVGDHEQRIVYLEDHMILNSRKVLNIKTLATKHVTNLLGGYGTDNYKENYRKVIRKLWHDYWNTFGVTSYRDTPVRMYDTALEWIRDWRYIHDSKEESSCSI